MDLFSIIPLVGKVIDKLFGDKDLAMKAKIELVKLVQEGDTELIKAVSETIKAEGNSQHWLVAAWRPITMLTFLGFIISWWFGYTPPNLTPEMLMQLFELIKLGLGGYIVGRSAEKVVKMWKEK